MKIVTTKDEIAPIIARVARAVPTKPSDPNQAAIRMVPHFNTDGSTSMVASAFDGDTGIKGSFKVEVTGEMIELRPSGLAFADIIKDLPDGEVTIELKEGNLWIKAKRSNYRIPQLSDSGSSWNVPPLPEKVGDLSGIIFADGLSKVIAATSKNISLPTLNAVKFEALENSLRFIATDRYRLSLVDLGFNRPKTDFTSLLVPTKTATELIKNFGKSDNVSLYFSDSLGGISDGTIDMVFRIIAGEFPKYAPLVEVATSLEVELLAEDIKGALKRVNKFNPEFVKLLFKDKSLTLSNSTSEDGEGNEDIDISSVSDEISISFNPTYIGDAFNFLQGESTIYFSENSKAVIIKSPNTPGYLTLVMPVQK